MGIKKSNKTQNNKMHFFTLKDYKQILKKQKLDLSIITIHRNFVMCRIFQYNTFYINLYTNTYYDIKYYHFDSL